MHYSARGATPPGAMPRRSNVTVFLLRVVTLLTLMTGSTALVGLGLLVYEPATESQAGQDGSAAPAITAMSSVNIPPAPDPVATPDYPVVSLETPVDRERVAAENRLLTTSPLPVPTYSGGQPTSEPGAIIRLEAPTDHAASEAEARIIGSPPSILH